MAERRAINCVRAVALIFVLPTVASALLLLGTLALSSSVSAQDPGRLPKIGILSPGTLSAVPCQSGVLGFNVGCFVDGLRALGYVDERNVSLEYRFADGDYSRLPALAAELVALRPDVIFTFTVPGAEAAAKATTTIPIVVGPAGEETIGRLAGNLARPTSNVTGTTLFNTEWDQKCLQLLKEIAPRTSRVAVLVNPDNPGWRGYPGILGSAATPLGMTLIRVDARGIAALPQALAASTASRVDAIFMANDAALAGSGQVRKQMSEWALSRSLPLAATSTLVAHEGGLISLGTDIPQLAARDAYYVQRILNGAKPSDLPVERPATFKLSVNLKTARVLGLTIPQSLLVRADEVIQ
jgi:putative ABC transport system substrate-binding protein